MSNHHHDWIKLYSQNNESDTAVISPDNRGLAYADGFFTTMGVIDGKILWQDYHQQRLSLHAHALQLEVPSQAITMRLQADAKQLQQGMMKLIITRATQAVRGYGFSPDELGSACDIWLKATAMPLEPFTRRFGKREGMTEGCISVSSKFG